LFRSLFESLHLALRHARSFLHEVELARSRSPDLPVVRVVLRRGRRRLDAPTVNYSFGTLHTILDAALQQVDVRRRAPRRVLVLGLGAGSIVHLLRRRHGVDAPIVAVECDSEVLRLAREHFALADWPDLHVVRGDAAAFVHRDTNLHDLVVVDVFVDAAVPASVRAPAFLAALRERLAPGGLLLFNATTEASADDPATNTLERDLRRVLPTVRALMVQSNVVFVAERER
jgi:spermidine synthase